MVPSFYDFRILRLHDSMIPWFHDFLILWFHDSVISWATCYISLQSRNCWAKWFFTFWRIVPFSCTLRTAGNDMVHDQDNLTPPDFFVSLSMEIWVIQMDNTAHWCELIPLFYTNPWTTPLVPKPQSSQDSMTIFHFPNVQFNTLDCTPTFISHWK